MIHTVMKNDKRKNLTYFLFVLFVAFCLSACTKCRPGPILCTDNSDCPVGMICADSDLSGIPLVRGICAYDISCGGIAGFPCPEDCLTCIDDPRDDCSGCCDCIGVCAPGISGLLANTDNPLDNEANTSF